MKKVFKISLLIAVVFTFHSCSLSTVDGNEEGVFTKKPWFFGKGGVDLEPLINGSEWRVFSTDFDKYVVSPVQYEETFEDAITNNNTPVDFSSYLTLKIQTGKSPELHKKFGPDWYNNNVKSYFREFVRGQISKYDMFVLTSDRDVYDSIKLDVQKYTEELIHKKGLPVDIISIAVGRAKPNQLGLEEMDRTAAQIQAKETQSKKKEAEDARMAAEVAKARADMAYREQMKLTGSEFLQLRALEIEKEKIEMIKGKSNVNIDILLGNATNLWDIKQK
jgi:hypothetical protein